MLTEHQQYRTALNLEIECVRSAVAHDPLADETTQARLGLLVAVSEYEDTITATKLARATWHFKQSEENAEAAREAAEKRVKAGAKLKAAIKKMNTLEGQKPYAEREILGVRWKPAKGDLPHRL